MMLRAGAEGIRKVQGLRVGCFFAVLHFEFQ